MSVYGQKIRALNGRAHDSVGTHKSRSNDSRADGVDSDTVGTEEVGNAAGDTQDSSYMIY